MNRSMLVGVIGGIAVATAGGVAGYSFSGRGAQTEMDAQGSALVIEEPAEVSPVEQPAAVARPAAVTQPAPVARSVPKPAAAPVAYAQPAPAAVVEEECWDEEVTVQVDPKDEHAIAGTAAGAVIGGALAKKIGDDNKLATAAGAAAGAFIGRRAQKEIQANNTTTTIERRCAPVGTR